VVRGGEMRPTAGGGVATLANPRIDFCGPANSPPSPGLGALGHFDLEFPGLDEVVAVDPEAAGSDLFDGGILRVAQFVGPDVAFGVFAAFAGVAFSPRRSWR